MAVQGKKPRVVCVFDVFVLTIAEASGFSARLMLKYQQKSSKLTCWGDGFG
jgi:hypothetical protein